MWFIFYWWISTMCKMRKVVPAPHGVGFRELPNGVFLEEPDHPKGARVRSCLRIWQKRSSVDGAHPSRWLSGAGVQSILPDLFLPFPFPLPPLSPSFLPSANTG